MHELAVGIAQQLHLDMPGPAHEFFQIDLVIAEGRLGLGPRRRHRVQQPLLALHRPHAAPAAAPARLQHHRVADLGGEAGHGLIVMRQRAGGGHHRHADRGGQLARRHLIAEPAHRLRGRADEDDARRRAGRREIRVLGEEAIAGMDGLGPGLAGDAHHLLDGEIGLDRPLALADQIGFVRFEAVERKLVMLRIDGDGGNSQLGGGAKDADRDLPPVGHEQTAEMLHESLPLRGLPEPA